MHAHTDVQCDSETLESGPTRTAAETVFAPLHSASLPPLHSHTTTTNFGHSLRSAEQYSPRASPVHVPLHLSLSSSSVKSSLAHLQRSRNMREMALLAEKVLTHTYVHTHTRIHTHTQTHSQAVPVVSSLLSLLQDREDLEEECKFLESLQNNTGVFLDG